MRPYLAGHDARRLPRSLTAAYIVLIAIACLTPFEGWRGIGASPFTFLSAPLPKYHSWPNTILNVLGYIPLGFVWVACARTKASDRWVFLQVTFGSFLLCFSLETIQNYLPTRVPSNLDIATNTLGGMLGALIGLFGRHVFDRRGFVGSWRYRRFLHGKIGEIGLILVGLWWLTQFEPMSILFSTGDLRPVLDLPELISFEPRRYMALEAAMITLQMLAVGLMLRRCMREPTFWLPCFVMVVGVVFKSIAGASFTVSGDPWQWASPGALVGLLLGMALLRASWDLSGQIQHLLACVVMVLGVLLVNLAPNNPFDLVSESIKPGNFLNFTQLTRLISSLWPVFFLLYMIIHSTILARRSPRKFS